MNKHSFSATLLVALFVLSLVLSPFSGVFAANGTNITTPWDDVNNPFPSQSTTAGQLKVVDLEPNYSAFTDSLNRTLTYRVTGNNISSHTHVARNSSNNNHLTLYYTVQNAGDYVVTIIAEYIENDEVIDSASFDILIHVDSAAPASSEQVDYNETDASSVIVYVTVSNDGMPIRGNDSAQTKLACYEVEVPYFSLQPYGLTAYNRYPEGGGNTVIQRPTMLHLYIYLLERFYMGRPDADCGSGVTNDYNVFTYSTPKQVSYIDGGNAYYNNGTYYPLNVSGGAGSLYMINFWGHDANLMYYRNHVFPLMSDGWGATADYALLDDYDYIDIAMFTDWGFYSSGAFLCFNSDEFVAKAGLSRDFEVMQFSTTAAFGYETNIEEMYDELDVDIYNSSWTKVADLSYTSNSNVYSYTFTSPGIYYIVARDLDAKSSDACYAPAVAIVTVNP